MPQQLINKEQNTFVRGLITESGPLTYPENASTDEKNFILTNKGYRYKRKGIAAQTSSPSFIDFGYTGASSYQINSFIWEAGGDSGELRILVVQVGDRLKFFDASDADTSLILQPLNSGNYLEVYAMSTTGRAQFANIGGMLVITGGGNASSFLEYIESTDTIEETVFGLLVRDLWGVEDGFELRDHPISGTTKSLYNLKNSGWGEEDPDNVTPGTPYYATYTAAEGEFPSRRDTVASGIDTSDQNKFKTSLVKRAIKSYQPAPNGFFIIDVFQRGLSRNYQNSNYSDSLLNNLGAYDWNELDPITSTYNFGFIGLCKLDPGVAQPPFGTPSLLVPDDTTVGGFRCIASFSGRVFYGGFYGEVDDGDNKTPDLKNHILFSQTIDRKERICKCYQEADPTSYEDTALVDTDGGYLQIQEVGSIKKLVPFSNMLLVLANNGIWSVSGGESGYFKATDFSVEKISDVGISSVESTVLVKDKLFFWADSGIYMLSYTLDSLSFNVQNITENTIQTYFNTLSQQGKEDCIGSYNAYENTVSWCYTSLEAPEDISNRFLHDTELVLDLNLNAFYILQFGDPEERGANNYPHIVKKFSLSNNRQFYLVGQSVTSGGNVNKKLTFCQLEEENTFLDWNEFLLNGYGYEAYMETGFEILQDTQRQKQVQYITTHMGETGEFFVDSGGNLISDDPSSCLMSTYWDYITDTASPKRSTGTEIYRQRRDVIPSGAGAFDYPRSIITTKNKIRGRGRSLKMRFESPAGYNCILYGWGVTYKGNTGV